MRTNDVQKRKGQYAKEVQANRRKQQTEDRKAAKAKKATEAKKASKAKDEEIKNLKGELKERPTQKALDNVKQALDDKKQQLKAKDEEIEKLKKELEEAKKGQTNDVPDIEMGYLFPNEQAEVNKALQAVVEAADLLGERAKAADRRQDVYKRLYGV